MGGVGVVVSVVSVMGVVHHTYCFIVLINRVIEWRLYYLFVPMDVSNLYFEFLNLSILYLSLF